MHYPAHMRSPLLLALQRLHAHVSSEFDAIVKNEPQRFQCARGCFGCCQDELTVFEVEAELIRTVYGHLLATGVPHAPGACAFLNDAGACRVYEVRPLVCRGQGAPLRWQLEDGTGEARSICPLNEEGAAVETLQESVCLELGPPEAVLAMLQQQFAGNGQRILLRQLFKASCGETTSTSSSPTFV